MSLPLWSRPTVDLLGPAPAEGCRRPSRPLPSSRDPFFMPFAQRGRCVVTRLLQPTDPVAQPFRFRRVASDRGQPYATAAGDGAAPRPNQSRHERRGPHDLLLLPPAINTGQPQGHCVARRPRLLHPHLRAVREGGAAPASRPALLFAVAAAACRRPLATPWCSCRSTFRRSPRRAPYASISDAGQGREEGRGY